MREASTGTYVAIITRAYMEDSKVMITTVSKLTTGGQINVENPSVIVVGGDVVREGGLKAMKKAGINFESNT